MQNASTVTHIRSKGNIEGEQRDSEKSLQGLCKYFHLIAKVDSKLLPGVHDTHQWL